MDLFDSHSIEKMAAEHDLDGLYKLLDHRSLATRMEAAQALAELNDGTGWRYLIDSVTQDQDLDRQITAAGLLGEMDHRRAIPALGEALKQAHGEAADAIKNALETIGGPEADAALREAGYEPVLPQMSSNQQTIDYNGQYVRALRPDPTRLEFLTAEQHFDEAVSLRESESTEHGLVENSLALWLSPSWAAAWYLRGVLFEDMERNFEAVLCYRWALELDPTQTDAREALTDLEAEGDYTPLEAEQLLAGLASSDDREVRDAAAGLGDLGEDAPPEAVDALMLLLKHDNREVRHAVIEALGNIEDHRASDLLMRQEESAWLLRFALIEALAQLQSVAGLVNVLQKEMESIQERNPIFSSQKDPLLEVEYDRLIEIGVLAFEKTGDLLGLLTLAEGNTWVEVDEDEEEEEAGEDRDTVKVEIVDEQGEVIEDADLDSYVDEVAEMISLALERVAGSQLTELDADTLRRLAAVPDLTLLDAAEGEETEPEPVLVHDLSGLRSAAAAELGRRK